MKVRIKRVGILSAFKAGCLMSTLPIVFLTLLLLVAILNPEVLIRSGLAAVSVPTTLAITIVLVGIGAGIAGAIQAIIYNITSLIGGSVIMEMERVGKPAQARPVLAPTTSESGQEHENVRPRKHPKEKYIRELQRQIEARQERIEKLLNEY